MSHETASSREAIFQRVRAGLDPATRDARRAEAEAHLAARAKGPQPAFATTPEALAQRFQEKAESLSSTVSRVANWTAVPATLARWCADQGLDGPLVASPDLAHLPWADAGLAPAHRPAQDADAIGITGCFCAIAETGTLMLLSAPETPASLSLLPETHIALVAQDELVATMEDAFARLRAARNATPRAINFISGPSRTGDIEQTIVLGAHGPCRVHVVIIDEARPSPKAP